MNKIPTAKSFLLKDVDTTESGVDLSAVWTDAAVKAMIEFAKLHVRQALIEADIDPHGISTIYPESNIK